MAAAGPADGRCVLIIDDAEAVREEVRRVLSEQGLFERFLEADSGIGAFKLLTTERVDLILCDVLMPNVDGLKFLSMIREHAEFGDLPVIMLTGQEDLNAKLRGFGAGASDYLTKPFHEEELVARVKVHLQLKRLQDELREKNAVLEALSATDPLTKLRNRSFLEELFEVEFLRAQRYEVPLSFMVVDLDAFSRVNEEHGQLAADRSLVAVAKMLRSGMREHDLVARLEEDRFGVLLPHTPQDGACVLAQRFRRRLESTPVKVGRGHLSMTASFGVSGLPSVGVLNADDLRRRAKQALARAKSEGGNRVVRYVAR